MGHSGRSCISPFISYEGRGILSIWNEFQLWFQIKIRSLFKWYFLICVLCYCYSFVCVSVFILQVILHLWYKQVICKKKKQKKPRKNSIPAVHWGKIEEKLELGNVSLHMRNFFSLTKDYVLADTCVITPAHYIHEQSLIISDQNY